MEITVAKSAGFCFGVDRAIQQVYRLLEQGKRVYTLGPIIHNPQMVEELSAKGVGIVETPEETPKNGTIVIRSHGIPEQVLEKITALGLDYADATCPFVAKIHQIVRGASEQGKFVLIAGDAAHPEVEGIVGHCRDRIWCSKTRRNVRKS